MYLTSVARTEADRLTRSLAQHICNSEVALGYTGFGLRTHGTTACHTRDLAPNPAIGSVKASSDHAMHFWESTAQRPTRPRPNNRPGIRSRTKSQPHF